MPFLINLLKDLHPSINFTNFAQVVEIFREELDVKMTVEDLERYFTPSIEGIMSEYNYKLNMYE